MMLEVQMYWEDEAERTKCVAWVVPSGAGATLRLQDGEFTAHWDEDLRLAAMVRYSFPASKIEWKRFWHELRKAARGMGTRAKILDVDLRSASNPIPFPDVKQAA
jgi:hypothetical protein